MIPSYRKVAPLVLFLVYPCALIAQATANLSSSASDSPRTMLTQAVLALGGGSQSVSLEDFRGSGTVTYYWGEGMVKGNVRITGKGEHKFRLEADLPNGTRTWSVANGRGSLKETDGTERSVGDHNSRALASISFPLGQLMGSLGDSSAKVSALGLEMRNGIQVQHVRVEKSYPFDPDGMLRRLSQKDFFLDAKTLLVVAIQVMVKDENQLSGPMFPEEILFSDYRHVGTMTVPFHITETVEGQTLSSIQLANVTLNEGVADSEFER